jgi:hypothetical protein
MNRRRDILEALRLGGGMSKLLRTIPVAVIVATALTALPSVANAATQIGTTFTPGPLLSGANSTWLQAEYAAPAGGVITKWNYEAPATNVPQLKFKVARPAGGSDFTVIGESPVVVPTASSLNSYDIRISVQAGDVIGLYTDVQGAIDRPDPAFREFLFQGDVVPPNRETFDGPFQFMMDVSANLEPDCDNDGFGDETQDQNLSGCAPGTIPPPAPGTATATCKGLPATIVGTDGSDVRTGSLGQDVIAGLGGNDTLSGIAGNDVICGGAGRDTLRGGKGKDTLLGQKGKDTLKGGGGKDLCKGGKGNDTASKCEVEKSI